MPTAAVLQNRVIGGFEILSKVGAGGMGTVFKARQLGLDRTVALKVISPQAALNAAFTARFQREARASAKLNHPHIVQGIAAGQDEATGLWYFAMEFVAGPTLLSILKDLGVLPETRALEIARDIARALICAHKHGIVHCDIKPDNILLAPGGAAKLADLGLVRLAAERCDVASPGKAIGTPYYMSPEQARGEEARVDIRSDIYALGATLYHLLVGRPPFTGPTSAAIMTKHVTEIPVSAHVASSQVSPACGRLIDRMLRKDPAGRIQSPEELLAALQALLRGEGFPPPTQVTQAPRLTQESKISGRATRKAVRPATRRWARGSSAGNSTRASSVVRAARPPRAPEPVVRLQAPPSPGIGWGGLFRGVVTDLLVLIFVLGLAGAGFYYLRSTGRLNRKGQEAPPAAAGPEEPETAMPAVPPAEGMAKAGPKNRPPVISMDTDEEPQKEKLEPDMGK